MHIDSLFVVRHDTVGHNAGVAVTFLVIFLKYAVQVVLIVALDEFLLAEYLPDVGLFVCFLDGALYLAVGQHFIALKIYFVDLHFVVLVDYNIDDHLVLM